MFLTTKTNNAPSSSSSVGVVLNHRLDDDDDDDGPRKTPFFFFFFFFFSSKKRSLSLSFFLVLVIPILTSLTNQLQKDEAIENCLQMGSTVLSFFFTRLYTWNNKNPKQYIFKN